jgi:uncharacterized protein (TIGR00288 family)
MKKEELIALLIDCDNISHKAIEGIVGELSKYGIVHIRQAYGNWTKDNLKNWQEKLLEFAIKPIQQFDYTRQKNATDILMTIETMDLIHTKQVDAFAFATSDSDFTPVVMRVQAEGKKVYGFGEKKTPKPFITACSQFIFTENLIANDDTPTNQNEKPHIPMKKSTKEMRSDKWLVNLLRNAVEQTMDEYGWAKLSDVGQYISNRSSFSSLNFGYKKFSHLIEKIDLFDVYVDEITKQMSIRDKRYSDSK